MERNDNRRSIHHAVNSGPVDGNESDSRLPFHRHLGLDVGADGCLSVRSDSDCRPYGV